MSFVSSIAIVTLDTTYASISIRKLLVAKSKKFKQTKDIVRIALNDGKTQDQIAKMCRVTQSTVSKWKSGAVLANHSQMMTLLDEYGHRLLRAPFKLYERLPKAGATKFLRVEGKLILRERFLARNQCSNGPEITSVRVSVHNQGNDLFVFVVERTFASLPTKKARESGELLLTDRHANWLLCHVEQVSSTTLLESPQGLTDYLKRFNIDAGHFPSLERLPFILREALLKHGYKIEGLEEMRLPT